MISILLYHEVINNSISCFSSGSTVYTTLLPCLIKHLDWLENNKYININFSDWDEYKNRSINNHNYYILTFDGPYKGWFKSGLIQELAKRKIKAVFFITASWVKDGITWDDIRYLSNFMDAEGNRIFSIGSHSASHSLLIKNSDESFSQFDERIKNEIAGSKKTIEKEIRKNIYAFALPKGKGDMKYLRKYFGDSGYRYIRKATFPGRIMSMDEDLYSLDICYCDKSKNDLCDFINSLSFDTDKNYARSDVFLNLDIGKKQLKFITPPHLASPSRLTGERRMIEEINLLNEKSGVKIRKILDLGCGSGEYRFLFKDKEYIGIDIKDCNFKFKNDISDFLVGNASNIPLDDDSVDLVFCIYAFEYFDSPEKALDEIRRVLRRGGCLFLCIPNKFVKLYEGPLWLLRFLGLKKIPYASGARNEKFYSRKKIIEMAGKSNLKFIKISVACGYFVGIFKLVLTWYKIVIRYLLIFFLYVFVKSRLISISKSSKLKSFINSKFPLYKDRKVGQAKDYVDFKNIQKSEINKMNLLDRLYILSVKLLNQIDNYFSFNNPPEYIIIFKNEKK